MVNESAEILITIAGDIKSKKISDVSRMLFKDIVSKIVNDLRAKYKALNLPSKPSFASNDKYSDRYYIVIENRPVLAIDLHMGKPIDIIISPVDDATEKHPLLIAEISLPRTIERIAIYIAVGFQVDLKNTRVTISEHAI